jgi:hypothetical protein
MSGITTNRPAPERASGRGYFWLGIIAGLVGPGLFGVQLSMRHVFVPWYSPALATAGVVLLLASLAARPSFFRAVALVLIAALADGRPVTEADLRDGSRHAMVFFRGRW